MGSSAMQDRKGVGVMSHEPEPRPDYYKLPPRFIQDCHECGVDVGFYDHEPQLLVNPTHDQLRELRSRAEYYADTNGPDAAPPGLKVAAKALLKRMDALGLGL
jgi:hypothetical protein